MEEPLVFLHNLFFLLTLLRTSLMIHEGLIFFSLNEIEVYCRSDVDILRRCCLELKKLMKETCNLDPFRLCVTIASACNRVFRQEFLEEKAIGLIPS